MSVAHLLQFSPYSISDHTDSVELCGEYNLSFDVLYVYLNTVVIFLI